MDNKAYVQSLGIDERAQAVCLQAMSQYGENHWWEPDSPMYAYYALREEYTLRCEETIEERAHAVGLLVGRAVYSWELTRGTFDRLLLETEKAYKRMQTNG